MSLLQLFAGVHHPCGSHLTSPHLGTEHTMFDRDRTPVIQYYISTKLEDFQFNRQKNYWQCTFLQTADRLKLHVSLWSTGKIGLKRSLIWQLSQLGPTPPPSPCPLDKKVCWYIYYLNIRNIKCQLLIVVTGLLRNTGFQTPPAQFVSQWLQVCLLWSTWWCHLSSFLLTLAWTRHNTTAPDNNCYTQDE